MINVIFIRLVATQIFFMFTPNPGEMIQFDYVIFFSGGLVQPPTSHDFMVMIFMDFLDFHGVQ